MGNKEKAVTIIVVINQTIPNSVEYNDINA